MSRRFVSWWEKGITVRMEMMNDIPVRREPIRRIGRLEWDRLVPIAAIPFIMPVPGRNMLSG